MIPVPQSESARIDSPKLHHPFKYYDPEVVAVLTILLGLFQSLLGIPAYYMSIRIHLLFVCPVLVGAVCVTGGSLAMACERSPSRKLLKHCLYSSICGLMVGLCDIVVYAYAVNDIKYLEASEPDESIFKSGGHAHSVFIELFTALAALLIVYDIAALVLQFFLSFSALKGLKNN